MKYVIDLMDDIRISIQNNSQFILGVLALEKECDAQGNNTLAWGKSITEIKLFPKEKKLCFYVGNSDAIPIETLLNLTSSMSNKELMYEVYVSTLNEPKSATQPLIGFNDDASKKHYMLIIEE